MTSSLTSQPRGLWSRTSEKRHTVISVKVRSGIVGGVSLLLVMTAVFSATSSSAETSHAFSHRLPG